MPGMRFIPGCCDCTEGTPCESWTACLYVINQEAWCNDIPNTCNFVTGHDCEPYGIAGLSVVLQRGHGSPVSSWTDVTSASTDGDGKACVVIDHTVPNPTDAATLTLTS